VRSLPTVVIDIARVLVKGKWQPPPQRSNRSSILVHGHDFTRALVRLAEIPVTTCATIVEMKMKDAVFAETTIDHVRVNFIKEKHDTQCQRNDFLFCFMVSSVGSQMVE
jgi:hypothetical protein